jgi:hypothetical protein
MGANSNEFIKIRMEEEFYKTLPPEIKDNMSIEVVDVDGIDYSYDALWNDLKSKSTKAYKELKKREFDLRHKIT